MKGINAYRNARVECASPKQVLLMVFQNIVMRLEQGIDAYDEGDTDILLERSRLTRRLYGELLVALDDSHAPELCARLSRLYTWCIRQLAEAERERDATNLPGVLKVSRELLAGWEVAVTSRDAA